MHQAVDINVPIGCGGAPAFSGDIVVATAEGVVIVPARLADEAVEMTAFEDLVAEGVLKGPLDSAALPRDRGTDVARLCRVTHGAGEVT